MRFWALFILSLILKITFSQSVTPWLTKGDQTKLLEAQAELSFTPFTGGDLTITVNPSVEHQSVDGFGFCLTQGSAQSINSLSASSKVALLQELFGPNGMQISMLRIAIGASDLSNSTYTYNETPGDVDMNNFSLSGPDLEHLIPLLQEILVINPDIKILATPWTAPTWMKTNGTWIGGSLNPLYYEAYSKYFLKYIETMNFNGINIWGITPQNEPENPDNEPSMLMSSGTQINFINNHLGPALDTMEYSPKIIAFDHNCDNLSYPVDVLNSCSYVDGAAFHLYAGDISVLSQVRNLTGKNVYFTEQYTNVFGDFDGDLGWHMENVVTGSLNNGSKCVLEWNLATDASYGPHTTGGCTDCLGALTVNNSDNFDRNVSYYIIGHLSSFVQPGAKRIEVSTNSPALLVSAFKNPDNSLITLAYNKFGGLNDSQNVQLVVGSQKVDFSIPARSAVTFVSDSFGESSINEIQIAREKELIKIVNALGQDVDYKPNTLLIYQYSDGTSEKVFTIED